MRTRVLVAFFALIAFEAHAEVDAERITATRDLPGVSISRQQAILASLEKQGPYGRALSAYVVAPDDPALTAVRPEMLALLYRYNARGSGSNCYWTSMFALKALDLPERYMGLEEYDALLAAHFDALGPDAEPRAGDVLRLKRARGGVETHSVVYLGVLKGTGSTELVISKNGPQDGPYLVMNMWDLVYRVYPGSRVAGVYRRK